MKFYFNKFIKYLQGQNIEISIPYFLLLQKIKELIESGNIEVGRGKMSDKLKTFFNNQNIDYYTNETIIVNLDALLCEDLIVNHQDLSVNRIDSIQIKNFKGFSQSGAEDNGCRFDFTGKQKIIIYGPNGSGKSSFSEALEYILTGDIKECKRKNKVLTNYIKNNQNLGDIKIILNNNPELLVTGGEREFFKRCIIEKNRITEFSLFRSKDTGLDDHQDALTFLLGFEELDNFISSFVQAGSFSLQTKDTAKNDLESYQSSQQSERVIFDSKVQEFSTLQSLLLESNILIHNEDLEVYQINEEILKELEQSIITLEKEIQIPIILNRVHRHVSKDFEKLAQRKTEKETELGEYIKQIEEKRSQINFKNLYEAISSLPESDTCPACQTHKDQRRRDPFEIARTELLSMQKIIQLEENKKDAEKEIQIIINQQTQFEQEKTFNQSQLALINYGLEEGDYFLTIEKLLSESINIEVKQQELDKQKSTRDGLIIQINKYNDLKVIVEKGVQIGDSEIEEQKREAIRIENALNMHLQNIEISYRSFRSNMDTFYTWYMQNETYGMRNDVCEYYKKINKHDEESEQVTQIEPIINGNFTIKLIGAQGEITNDAVSYLSEGHLKALGLAVLWANMKKHNIPFMIFDDVVNAIDIEHRSNIIDILHTDEFLSSKQMVITTHDRLFWEKFCNVFETGDRNLWTNYGLVKELGGITAKEYKAINYDEKISIAISNYDLRQAVLYTRIWFEQMILDYCKKRNCEVKGNIKKSTISLYLETTIELLYGKFYQKIQREVGWDTEKNDAFEYLKNNTLNWEIINQEGHAHDDQTRNIIHSITSNEIINIQNSARTLHNYIVSIPNVPTSTQSTT